MSCAPLATNVFVGMQPLLTQVPPNRLRSIIATFIPVSASRTARDGPAWPVPITIASYLVAIGIPPLGLCKSYLRSAKDAPDLHSCEYTELFRTPELRLCKFKFFLRLLCMRSGIRVFLVTVRHG